MRSLFKISAFLIFCLCVFSNQLFANHAAGGSITYVHVSGNQYLIRASFYRDCVGDPIPLNFTVYISSVQCNTYDSIVLAQLPGILPVYPPCPVATTCVGGTDPGFHRCDFEGTYTFPSQCQDWVMSINLGHRRSAITTILNPSTTNLYLEARLNNQNWNNNSPQFAIDPIMLACIGKSRTFNPHPADPDGDSLVYELIPARSDANTNVTYNVSYSALQPLTSSPAITLNPANGDLIMFPQAQETGVAVYRVLEYRNSVLIGSVTYDMNIYTVPCPNSPPYTSGVNGTMDFTYYVLPGYFCFDIYTLDIDPADSVAMYFNTSGIPTATFTVNATAHPTGTFCWTPDSADVRPQPYTFTVILIDDGCPLPNMQVDTFYIIVTLDSSLVTQNNEINFAAEDVQLQVIPNPILENAEIRFGNLFTNIQSEFRTFDSMGKLVDNRIVNASRIQFSKGNLQKGIYFIELKNKFSRATGRLVIE